MKIIRFTAPLFAASLLAIPAAYAQSFASSGIAANSTKDAKVHKEKVTAKSAKPFDTEIREGVLTVDGMTAKVQLNYDVKNQNFLYIFMPGDGVAVISLSPLPNSLADPGGIDGNTLTFNADGHAFALTSTTPLVDKGRHDVWISMDRTSPNLARAPMMGYGMTQRGPYHWPGALPEPAHTASQYAPPLPTTVLPRLLATTTTTVPGSSE